MSQECAAVPERVHKCAENSKIKKQINNFKILCWIILSNINLTFDYNKAFNFWIYLFLNRDNIIRVVFFDYNMLSMLCITINFT